MLSELCPNPVVLAPMVGLSHYLLRKALQDDFAERKGPAARALWPTEMLSSRKIPLQKEGQSVELIFKDKGAGLWPQLLANEREEIRASVAKLEEWGASAIDINMGCPVQKALKHNYGVALMGDPEYAAQVTRWTVESSRLPVSVKLRAGLSNDLDFLARFVEGLIEAGAAWVTLHPRTAEEKRRGHADWNQIRFLRERVGIPVIGNGDIQNVADARRMLEETGADRVMAGRALTAKPWILALEEVGDGFVQGAEYGRFLRRFVAIARAEAEESQGMRRIRFLVYQGSVWLEFGHTLYAATHKAKNYDEVEAAIETFFKVPQRMVERTGLRR